MFLLLTYVKFADITESIAAGDIVPSVRLIITPDTHARLAVIIIVGLAWIPVGVCHSRHCSVRVRRSPDECGVTARIHALSSCPVVYCTQN